MKVTCHYRNDPERGLTDPLPEVEGRSFVLRLYSGDVLGPFGFGKSWFNPPFYEWVFHFFCSLPILPFIAWRYPKWLPFIGGKAGTGSGGTTTPSGITALATYGTGGKGACPSPGANGYAGYVIVRYLTAG